MCNVDKLLGKIRERGYTQETLAEAAGVSRATLARRIKEPENLTIKEIEKSAMHCAYLVKKQWKFFYVAKVS